MARHAARRAAEDDAPGQIGHRSPKLAVDEIGATPEEQADRRGDGSKVGKGPERDMRQARRHRAAEKHAYHAAVEAHAALVDREDLDRVAQVFAVAVEEAVSEARADVEAHEHAEDDRVQGFFADSDARDDDRGEEEPEDVRDAVPPDLQGADREGDGIERLVDIVQHKTPMRMPQPRRHRDSNPCR